MGIDLVQTKYFLKKDSYAIMLSKDMKSMVFCNVNERVLLQAEESLFSDSLTQVKEVTHGMFNITCSGASLSKDKDIFAVGDFTGNVKLFTDQSKTKLLKEALIPDQVRYLHFHDYHNQVLFIATFSGNVYVWNVLSTDSPQPLVHLNKTVTSIRTSHGSHRVNSFRSILKHYVIFGTVMG